MQSCHNKILLCTHNQLLIKSLYGVIRDEGYSIELADHPAEAVQMVMQDNYKIVIMDSSSFGLSAEEASQIIKTVAPEIRTILMGYTEFESDASTIKIPIDLEILKKLLSFSHTSNKFKITKEETAA